MIDALVKTGEAMLVLGWVVIKFLFVLVSVLVLSVLGYAAVRALLVVREKARRGDYDDR